MPHIHQLVFIAAPAEKVFEALTTQAGLAAWWTPDTLASPETGAVLRFTFGNGYFKEMRVEDLSAPVHVKWTCVAGAEEWIATSISFTLEAKVEKFPEVQDQCNQSPFQGKGCVLIFKHEDWRAYTPMYAECNYTWGRFLHSLKGYCETGTGAPWPKQHVL